MRRTRAPLRSGAVPTRKRRSFSSNAYFGIPATMSGGSHAHGHAPLVAALEVAVAGQRPEWEEFRVAVVAQVEHPREAAAGVVVLRPEAVVALPLAQPGDAAGDGRVIGLAG